MSVITFNYDVPIKIDFLSWIESNLKGRFWIGTVVKLVNNRTMVHNAVAFEDPYESTLFLLGCPDAAKSKV